jgi:glycosyltransferase involved in cell wall biosynthesis
MPSLAQAQIADTAKSSGAKLPPVGIVCHFPPPPGGMPGQAQAYVEGLRSEGIEAVAIATNLGTTGLGGKLESLWCTRSAARFFVFLYRLLRALPLVRILHVMACSGLSFFLFSAPAVMLGVIFRRRIVLQFQDGRAREFFRAWPRFSSWVCHSAHRVQVESKFLQKVFRDEMDLHAVVVPNLCSLERYSFRPARTMQPDFLVARHLEEIYNVACVIRAFAAVQRRRPGALLTVLGSGAEQAKLRRLAEELQVAEAVRFLGYVDNARMPELYEQASIALNASNMDNSPNAILEAFAAGLPVITTDAGGIPDLVEDGRTGFLVDLNDHEAMAAKAMELLDKPELAARIACNAREVAARHAWPLVFPELLKVYRTETELD